MPALPSAALLGWWAAAAALVALSPPGGLALALLLAVLFVVDARAARTRGAPELGVALPPRVGQGQPVTLRLLLWHRGQGRVAARAVVDVPRGLAATSDGAPPAAFLLEPGRRHELLVALTASERGTHALGALHLRLLAPLGLAWWCTALPLQRSLEVVPGLAEVGATRLLAWRARRVGGRRPVRRREESGSFESLREAVRGDDGRLVDWKATARRGRLIVRQFEAERSQGIVLCIDAGRLMAERVGGRQRLDQALAAAVVLSDVARSWDDHVGVLAFADDVSVALPPGRYRPDVIPSLLAHVEARSVEPDYPKALARLSRLVHRRSLLVFFGDVIDTEVSAPLAGQLARLARRHLPLFLALRNTDLVAASRESVADLDGACRRAAACELLGARARTLLAMRRAGVSVVDTAPDGTVAAAVSRYIRIKQAGLL